jgi:hypothetical protein
VVSTVASLTSALANTAIGHIVLAPGTYSLSAELNVTRSVILEAAVSGTVVLNAQARSSSQRRVLFISPGSSGVVQLIRLNITGGYIGSLAWGGGGVYVEGGTVAISACTISGNTAGYGQLQPENGGGGVWVQGGTVAISSCTISGNTAYYGGGVYVHSGTVSIVNSLVYFNQAAAVRDRAQNFPSPRWEHC